MEKEYKLKFNPASLSWEPVCVRAKLQIGHGEEGKEEYMPIFPNFTVEDSPDIRFGAGGISSEILDITDRKVLSDGKTAEFYVSMIKPDNPEFRDKMMKIVGDQMAFSLKVTLNPANVPMPGVFIPTVGSMVKNPYGTVTIFVDLPGDRLATYPDDNPIIVPTNTDENLIIKCTCERINFENMKYETLRDERGRGLTAPLWLIADEKDAKSPLHYHIGDDNGVSLLYLMPKFFKIGDGKPVDAFELNMELPKELGRPDTDGIRIPIKYTTHPVEIEFRIIKNGKELLRETKTLSSDIIDMEVVAEDKNMDFKDTYLHYLISRSSDYFRKTYYDTGKILIEERFFEINIAKKTDNESSREPMTLEIKAQQSTGILQVFKYGWLMYDEELDNILSESARKELDGARLEVRAEAAYDDNIGRVHIDTKDLIISDSSGRLYLDNDEIAGKYEDGLLKFQIGESATDKIIPLKVKLYPDEYIKDSLESIYGEATKLDKGLGDEVSYFGRGILSLLARSSEDDIKSFIGDFYEKLNLTGSFFRKYTILKKYLELSFKLRNEAAKRVFDNLVGLLVEIASLFIQIGISQGSISNAESKALHKEFLDNVSLRDGLRHKKIILSKDIEKAGARISDIEDSLIRIGKELESTQNILSVYERDLLKDPTNKSLQELVKKYGQKAGLEKAGIKAMPEIIAKQKNEILRLKGKIKSSTANEAALKESFDTMLKGMRKEIGMSYTAATEGAEEAGKDIFSYDSIKAMIESATEQLGVTFIEYIEAWDKKMKSETYVNPLVNELYRDKYANYLSGYNTKIDGKTPEKMANMMSGKALIRMVEIGEKPQANWHDTQFKNWSKEDVKRKLNFEDQLRNLGRDFLRIDTDDKEWGLKLSKESYQNVSISIDKLISIIKDYERAFDEGGFVDPFNIPSWQDMDNLVNTMSFWTATGVRVLAGATLITGVGAPLALMLSKTGDLIDMLGAVTQAVIASLLTMPETNGLMEAVPLLASMLHNGLTEEVYFSETIITK